MQLPPNIEQIADYSLPNMTLQYREGEGYYYGIYSSKERVRCPHCGNNIVTGNGSSREKYFYDLVRMDKKARITCVKYRQPKYRCRADGCGKSFVLSLPYVEEYAPVTKRFEDYIGYCCLYDSFQSVAKTITVLSKVGVRGAFRRWTHRMDNQPLVSPVEVDYLAISPLDFEGQLYTLFFNFNTWEPICTLQSVNPIEIAAYTKRWFRPLKMCVPMYKTLYEDLSERFPELADREARKLYIEWHMEHYLPK